MSISSLIDSINSKLTVKSVTVEDVEDTCDVIATDEEFVEGTTNKFPSVKQLKMLKCYLKSILDKKDMYKLCNSVDGLSCGTISAFDWLRVNMIRLITVLKRRTTYIDGKVPTSMYIDVTRRVHLRLNDGSNLVSNPVNKTPLATDKIFNNGISTQVSVTVKQTKEAIERVNGKMPIVLQVENNKFSVVTNNGNKITTELSLDFKISLVVNSLKDLPSPLNYVGMWAVVKYSFNKGLYVSQYLGDGTAEWVCILKIPTDLSISGQVIIVKSITELNDSFTGDNDYGIVYSNLGIEYFVYSDSKWNSIQSIVLGDVLASNREFDTGVITTKAVRVSQLSKLFTNLTCLSYSEIQNIFDSV